LFRLDLSLMALEASIVLSGCGKTLPSDNTLTIAQDMLASATMTALAASPLRGLGTAASLNIFWLWLTRAHLLAKSI